MVPSPPSLRPDCRHTTHLLAAAALLALLATQPLGATTLVMPPDTALVDQSALVVEAVVVERSGAPDRAATDYRLRVERPWKGAPPAAELLLRVPGGRGPSGMELVVWGAPALVPGERALLFLLPRPDGAWGALHLAAGVFHEQRGVGSRLALRDLAEVQALDAAGGAASEPVRDFERFARWVGDRAAGVVRPADYLVPPSSGAAWGSRQEKFSYLRGIKQRWIEFDQNKSISWRAHQSGQPGLAGGGFAQFQTAIAAWNDDAATNIRYTYGGTTSANDGFQDFDGVNTLLFEDPHGEVSGTFVCSSPGTGFGTLALGGTWILPSDPQPIRIHGADIVINNGAGCWFHTGKRAEQVYGHELGHTLGLGHSCGDGLSGSCDTTVKNEALMRATAHGDERGAALNGDDRAGILDLYSGGSGGGGAPAAPSNLVAVAASASSIQLGWTDNAGNETALRVEMKVGEGSFVEVLSLPANSTSTTVGGLVDGTSHTFRVRARNGSGFSAYSNQSSATTPLVPPSALTATLLAADEVRLDWSDGSGAEAGFQVERSSPDTGWILLANLPPDTETLTVPSLPDTPYSFRVRAEGVPAATPFSNVASITTGVVPTVACTSGGDPAVLCLGGGRFQVVTRWRTDTAGVGTAVPLAGTDQSGMFWFFGPQNIELIVKELDGRPLTGAFWFFYGALSDVEYWITVTDTQTGVRKTYHNEPGSLCGLGDVDALPAPSAAAGALAASGAAASGAAAGGVSAAEAAGPCAPGALCLLDGRFEVTVDWQTADGSGTGTPVAVPGSQETGLFWFFGPDNIELVVKALDARTVNGKYWIYYGALSDVRYDLHVRDTVTGAQKTYSNPAGNLCGRGDVDAFVP